LIDFVKTVSLGTVVESGSDDSHDEDIHEEFTQLELTRRRTIAQGKQKQKKTLSKFEKVEEQSDEEDSP